MRWARAVCWRRDDVSLADAVAITRPGAAGKALAEAVASRGIPALWLPAFELLDAPDPAAVREGLGRLDRFDLVVFVSPAAVRAVAPLLSTAWPVATRVGVVGQGTAAAVRDAVWAGRGEIDVIEPDATLAGSEALWQAIAARRSRDPATPWPRTVLVLRAESGREWLAEQLQADGAQVEALAVYRRRSCAASAEALAKLAAWRDAGHHLATVLTSSEAVTAQGTQLAAHPMLLAALRAGSALVSHPRIAAAARAAGFATVRVVPPEADQIAAALVA
jgi:uroporphyrinogen-III synthase